MSKIRIAINGFGRIGRVTFRKIQEKSNMEIVAINDLTDPANLAHLLKYDSVQGPFKGKVEHNGNHIIVNGKKVLVLNEPNPAKLPWKDLNIDIVIESTGEFTTRKSAIKHVEKSGAKKVIISAPAKGESDDVAYVVLGVNDEIINRNDKIISNASCTTNNVAPLIKILDEMWGIEKALLPLFIHTQRIKILLMDLIKIGEEEELQHIQLFQQQQVQQKQQLKYFHTLKMILVAPDSEFLYPMVR